MQWFALLAGPIAWVLDEGIALVIEANTCVGGAHSAPALARVALIVTGLLALCLIGAGAAAAMRAHRSMDSGDRPAAIRVERSRFLAAAAFLLAGVSAFGVLLRLIAALSGGVCG